ncbi:MAG TPA: hypothetical protein PLL88_08080 [Anaerolineaceae bacterium]|jgi:poly(A) polymerase|nr:hypothetical protein [Anaerolineaceae bacterium]
MKQFAMQENEFFQTVLFFLRSLENTRIYLVGGAVRDALLGKPSHDFDFIVEGDALATARKLANHIKGAFYVLDSSRNYARVIAHDSAGVRNILDFAPLYQNELTLDLQSRDFTVNAIAWEISSERRALTDPLHGMADLENGVLKLCSDGAFASDPVRMIRAARFAVEYKLELETPLRAQVRASASKLGAVSEERRRDELFKILENERVATALEILRDMHVLEWVYPEVYKLVGFQQGNPHRFDGWQHTLKTVHYSEGMLNFIQNGEKGDHSSVWMLDVFRLLDEYAADLKRALSKSPVVERSLRSLILFSALHHDVGKPLDRGEVVGNRVRYAHHAALGAKAALRCAQRMALSKAESQWVEQFVSHHMLLHDMDIHASEMEQRVFLYRFFQSAGRASPFVALFSLADLLATYDDALVEERWRAGLVRCAKALNGWFREHHALAAPEPLLDGDELQKKFHLKPGKQLGELLDGLREAQAAGKVKSKSQAIKWVDQWLQKTKD